MNKEIICGIYKITSPTGNVYIGQSIDIHKRFATYRKLQCKTQPRLLTSFKGHGVDSHKFEIIHVCTETELNKLEKYYVDLYNCFNTPHGLNLIDGGGNQGKRSEETKKKNSVSSSGENNWNFGKKQSPEHIKRRTEKNIGLKRTSEQIKRMLEGRKGKPVKKGWHHKPETIEKFKKYHNRPDIRLKKSKERMGEKNPQWGKRPSEETRRKIGLKSTGRKHTPEAKKKLSDNRKGSENPMYGIRLENSGMSGKKHSQRFYELRSRILLNTNTGIFYYGLKEASKTIGMKHLTLAAKLRGQSKNDTSFIYA